MSELPRYVRPVSPVISPASPESLGHLMQPNGINYNSASNTPTANAIAYIPFSLKRPVTVYNLFWVNGANIAGNVDVGIYTTDGVRVISAGSTVQATANVLQSVSVTPFTLGAGAYYLAGSESSASGRIATSASLTVVVAHEMGILNQLGTFPLPATATFATASIANYIPLVGFSTIPTI